MTTNPPESVETRLSRLESLFTNIGETVLSQSEAINALSANVNNLAEQTNRNINELARQAAADRQQAAIDRQAWQAEIQRIWQYLLNQSGNGRGNA